MLPQIILIAFYCLSLGMILVKHGEPREDKYNFWSSFLATAIVFLLLYWGGFFGVFFK